MIVSQIGWSVIFFSLGFLSIFLYTLIDLLRKKYAKTEMEKFRKHVYKHINKANPKVNPFSILICGYIDNTDKGSWNIIEPFFVEGKNMTETLGAYILQKYGERIEDNIQSYYMSKSMQHLANNNDTNDMDDKEN